MKHNLLYIFVTKGKFVKDMWSGMDCIGVILHLVKKHFLGKIHYNTFDSTNSILLFW